MERNDTYLRRQTPISTCFQLIIDLPHLLSLFHPSSLLHTLLPSLLNSYSASILDLHAIMVAGPSSPP